MFASDGRAYALTLHPLHAALTAGAAPLFTGAMFSDLAYASAPHPQWANFASWLLIGAMVLTGLALAFSLFGLMSERGRGRGALLVLGILVATFVIGFVDALMHTRDAWAMMPGGLVLSIFVTVTAIAATWVGFSGPRKEVAL